MAVTGQLASGYVVDDRVAVARLVVYTRNRRTTAKAAKPPILGIGESLAMHRNKQSLSPLANIIAYEAR